MWEVEKQLGNERKEVELQMRGKKREEVELYIREKKREKSLALTFESLTDEMDNIAF